MTRSPAVLLRCGAGLLVAILAGCASVGPTAPGDPLEPFNRASYAFNDKLDQVVLKPVAIGYTKVTPQFVRSGVTNVFENVYDVATAVNNLLQGKPGQAASDVGRVVVNSTLGILGLWDVATPMGLEKHNEDFGQTLGRWGVGSGPYLVVPLFGPTTLRDGIGRLADTPLGYYRYIDDKATANGVFALEMINTRANLLNASDAMDTAALDRYNFLRDAYLQRRLRQVYDGKVPQEKLDELDASLEVPDDRKPADKAPPPAEAKPPEPK